MEHHGQSDYVWWCHFKMSVRTAHDATTQTNTSYMHKSHSVKLSQMWASCWACMTTGEREISKKKKKTQQMTETQKKCNTQFRQIDGSGWCDSQQEEQIKAGRWRRRGWWRGIHTYPALLLSSSQPLDWPGLGSALPSHWGRATQNHTPKEGVKGRKDEKGVERKVDGGVLEKGIRGSGKQRRINLKEGLQDR